MDSGDSDDSVGGDNEDGNGEGDDIFHFNTVIETLLFSLFF